jgi:ribosome-associated protein
MILPGRRNAEWIWNGEADCWEGLMSEAWQIADLSEEAGNGQVDSARSMTLLIADALTETPATNSLVLDIRKLSSFADYFVICSGENERQLRAIAEEIGEQLREHGYQPRRVEGTPRSGWIVLDYGDTVVHVFDEELREFYKMERLWAEAPRLLSIQWFLCLIALLE